MKWVEALKVWNEKKGGKWCVPRKGSPEHAEVMKIIGSEKKPAEKKEVSVKPAEKKPIAKKPTREQVLKAMEEYKQKKESEKAKKADLERKLVKIKEYKEKKVKAAEARAKVGANPDVMRKILEMRSDMIKADKNKTAIKQLNILLNDLKKYGEVVSDSHFEKILEIDDNKTERKSLRSEVKSALEDLLELLIKDYGKEKIVPSKDLNRRLRYVFLPDSDIEKEYDYDRKDLDNNEYEYIGYMVEDHQIFDNDIPYILRSIAVYKAKFDKVDDDYDYDGEDEFIDAFGYTTADEVRTTLIKR